MSIWDIDNTIVIKFPESYNNPTHEATTRSRKATITLPHERSYLPQNTSVMSVKT